MLIIPSIELFNHKSKFVIKGIEGSEEFYENLSALPENLCKLFRLENVKSIHITDTDSFIDHDNNNYDIILLMTEATFLPFQVLTNFKSIDDCRNLLEYGVHRIILSDFAYKNPEIVKKLIDEYSERRIAFYLPVENGNVVFEHSNLTVKLSDYVNQIKSLGGERVILRQLSNNKIIPDIELLKILSENFNSWTYEYDIKNYSELKQLEAMEKYKMDSVIIGESFYNTNFPCQKIWRLAESQLDVPGGKIVTD